MKDTTEVYLITYTSRHLSDALPATGYDCSGDREVEERQRPCLWCALDAGSGAPPDNSFVLHMGCFIVRER